MAKRATPYDEFERKYYKIGDVSDILGVPQSTLRYWEGEFGVSPMRTPGKARHYTAEDIRNLRIIHYLIRVRGMKIEAAKRQFTENRDNISRRVDIIDKLEEVSADLKSLLASLTKRK